MALDKRGWFFIIKPSGQSFKGESKMKKTYKFQKGFTLITTLTFLITSLVVFAGGDAPAEQGFKVKPVLQVVSQTSVGIAWESHNSSVGEVKISLSQNMSNPQILTTSNKKNHKVSVTGLTANTRYYYTVSADTETTGVASFLTALNKGDRSPFRFAVYGDTRKAHWAEDIFAAYGDNDDHLPVLQSMMSYSPDFLVHVGDFVYSGNDMGDIYNFFDVEKDLLAQHPLLPTYGNHEFKGGNTTAHTLMDSYLIPAPGSGGDFSYYSYDYGNVHILVLNTGYGVRANDNYDVITAGSAQNNFALQDLQAASADPDIDHIFVSMHNPLYSVAGFGDNTQLQNALEGMFKTYGVKAVFMGHEHDYQHQVKDGIHYILSGGGGSPILDAAWYGDENDSEADLIKYDDVLNYVIVDINGSTVSVESRKVQGNGNSTSSVIESFSL